MTYRKIGGIHWQASDKLVSHKASGATAGRERGMITHDEIINRTLATYLRKAHELHEASWTEQGYQERELDYNTARRDGPLVWRGKYTKDMSSCIREVVGDDPIALILDCLFTAGYCEMWEFCDQVLSKEDKA